jgi:enamine deaminase RidA (YjgF/YER057c/UK114 family)
MSRQPLTLGKPFEKKVPFSLGVVSSGRMLHTAGITARDVEGNLVGSGDMRAQVQQCFRNLADILEAAGTSFAQVVKYSIYTTDIALLDRTTRDIRHPYFVDRPASTLIEVSRLIDPGMLVEIEAIVCLDGSGASAS